MKNTRHPGWGGFFIVTVLLSGPLSPVLANSVGTSGASFLDIPVGAAPAALGSAYSVLANNAYAPVWNAAGLGFLPSTQVAAQHLSYVQGINYEFLSVAHPLSPTKGFGLSAQYLGSGNIAATDVAGNSVGTFSDNFGAYSAAYGQQLLPQISVGMAGKWIHAQLADVSANAFAADLGAFYKVTPKMDLAATVNNLGTTLKFLDAADSLPQSDHLAAAYRPTKYATFSAEGVYTREGQLSGRFGAEWAPLQAIHLRAGYHTDTLKELGAWTGITAGMGLDLWGQEFSYAWVPYGDLGNSQYFSFLLRFDGPDAQRRNLIQFNTIKRHQTVQAHSAVADDEADYQALMLLLGHDSPHIAQSK